jgi:tRNA A37 threonylcarbamoyladenosine dehydratase
MCRVRDARMWTTTSSFVLGAATGAAVAAAVVGGFLSRRRRPNDDLRQEEGAKRLDAEILEEQFTRNVQFLGLENQQRVHAARVLVVGGGGVGSHAAIALARGGVLNIRVIDFDRVTVSSLNRHASGTLSEVGMSKVESIKRAIKRFSPWTEVDAIERMFTREEADELIKQYKPDYVIDCIDNVPTKVDLLEYCVKEGIRVVTSCGSACKKDPSKIRIGHLGEVYEDELGRAVRQKLRGKEVDVEMIKTVFSCEKSSVKLLPLKEFQQGNSEEFRTIENFRIRILPVLGFLPSIFGQALACIVVTDIGNASIENASSRELITAKTKRTMWEAYAKWYKLTGKQVDALFPNELTDELVAQCGRKCAISGKTVGTLVFLPKDPSKPPGDKHNLVLLAKSLVRQYLETKASGALGADDVM